MAASKVMAAPVSRANASHYSVTVPVERGGKRKTLQWRAEAPQRHGASLCKIVMGALPGAQPFVCAG